MRKPQAAILVLVTVIGLTFACGFLATGASCPDAAEYPVSNFDPIGAFDQIAPGSSFEFVLAPADVNGFLASYLQKREHAVLDTVLVGFGADTISVDLCARRVLFRPVSTHIVFAVEHDVTALRFSCREWSVGRIQMPESLRAWLSRRLNAEWARLGKSWRIEQWAFRDGKLYLVGVRRH
jgi:hypothetical protein